MRRPIESNHSVTQQQLEISLDIRYAHSNLLEDLKGEKRTHICVRRVRDHNLGAVGKVEKGVDVGLALQPHGKGEGFSFAGKGRSHDSNDG